MDAKGTRKGLCFFGYSWQSPSGIDAHGGCRACGCPSKWGGLLTSPMGTASIARSYCTAPSSPCSWKTWSVSLEKSTASPSNTTRSGVLGACTSCWKTSAAETPARQSKVGLRRDTPSWGQPVHGQLLPAHLLRPHPTPQMLGSPSWGSFCGGQPGLSRAVLSPHGDENGQQSAADQRLMSGEILGLLRDDGWLCRHKQPSSWCSLTL